MSRIPSKYLYQALNLCFLGNLWLMLFFMICVPFLGSAIFGSAILTVLYCLAIFSFFLFGLSIPVISRFGMTENIPMFSLLASMFFSLAFMITVVFLKPVIFQSYILLVFYFSFFLLLLAIFIVGPTAKNINKKERMWAILADQPLPSDE